jgi:hypothetical protein
MTRYWYPGHEPMTIREWLAWLLFDAHEVESKIARGLCPDCYLL